MKSRRVISESSEMKNSNDVAIDVQWDTEGLMIVSFSPGGAYSSNPTCSRRPRLAPIVKKLERWDLLVARDSNDRRYFKAAQGTGNPYSSSAFAVKPQPVPYRYRGRYTAHFPFDVVERWVARSPTQTAVTGSPPDPCVYLHRAPPPPRREVCRKRTKEPRALSAFQQKNREKRLRDTASLREMVRKLRSNNVPRLMEKATSALVDLKNSDESSYLPTVLVMFEDEDAPFLTLKNCVHPLDSIAQLRELITREVEKLSGSDFFNREMAWTFSRANPPLASWLDDLFNDFLTFYTDNEHMRLSGQAAKEVRFATKQHRYLAEMLKPQVQNVRRLTERMMSVFQLCVPVKVPSSIFQKYGTPQSNFFGQAELFYGPDKMPLITSIHEIRDAVKPVRHAALAQLERMITSGAPPVDCGLSPYKVTFQRAGLQVIANIRRERAKAAFRQSKASGVPYLPIICLRKLPKLFTNLGRTAELQELSVRDAVTSTARPLSSAPAVPFVPTKNKVSPTQSPTRAGTAQRGSRRSVTDAMIDDHVAALELAMEGLPSSSLRWADALGLSLTHYAVLRQDLRLLQALSIRGADISVPDSAGCTALHRILLLRNCGPSFKMAALSELLRSCDAERMLMKAIRARLNYTGDSVVSLAAKMGSLELVQSILSILTERLLPRKLTDFILEEEIAAITDHLPVTKFITTGDVSGVRFWLENMQLDPKLFRSGTDRVPALSLALSAKCDQDKKDEVVSLFVFRGADPMDADAEGRTALHYAVLSKQMKWLLPLVGEVERKKSDDHCGTFRNRMNACLTKAVDRQGNTFLHTMLQQCRVRSDVELHGMQVLTHPSVLSSLELGQCNSHGDSLLHLAMNLGSTAIAKQLTKTLVYESHNTIETLFGARNNAGDTPVACAVRSGFAAGVHMTLALDVVAEVALRTRNSFDRSLLLLTVDVEGSKTFVGDVAPAMANRPHCKDRTEGNVLHALLTYCSSLPNSKEIIDEISGDRGESALHAAVRHALWHTAAMLVTFQASPVVRSPVSGLTPLQLSFANKSNSSIPRLLLANDRSGVASLATLRLCIAAGGAASFNMDLLQQHFFARDSLFDHVATDDTAALLAECVATGNLSVLEKLFLFAATSKPRTAIDSVSPGDVRECTLGAMLKAALEDRMARDRNAARLRLREKELGPSSPQYATFDVESLAVRMLLLGEPAPVCAMLYAAALGYHQLADLLVRLDESVQLDLFSFTDPSTGRSTLHQLCECQGESWWNITAHAVWLLGKRLPGVFCRKDKCGSTPLHVARNNGRVDLMLLLLTQRCYAGQRWTRTYPYKPIVSVSRSQWNLCDWVMNHADLPLELLLSRSLETLDSAAVFEAALVLPGWDDLIVPVTENVFSVMEAIGTMGDLGRLENVVGRVSCTDDRLVDALLATLKATLQEWPHTRESMVSFIISALRKLRVPQGQGSVSSLLKALFGPAKSVKKRPRDVAPVLGSVLNFLQTTRINSPEDVAECLSILSAAVTMKYESEDDFTALDSCIVSLIDSDDRSAYCTAFSPEILSEAIRRNFGKTLTVVARSFSSELSPFTQLRQFTQQVMPQSGKWLVNALAAAPSVPCDAIACVLDKAREEVYEMKLRCVSWVEELLDLRSSKFQDVPHSTRRQFPVLCYLRSLATTDPATVPDFGVGGERNSLLHAAITHNRTDLVHHILHVSPFAVTLDLHLDVEDHCQRTPLLLAARRGRTAIFRDLLSAGANAMCEDNQEFTCLHAAAKNGIDELIQAIKEHDDGVHVLRSTTSKASNALLQAVKAGHDHSACLLLSYPTFTDSVLSNTSLRGENLIHLCALRNCTQTLRILLRRCGTAYITAVTPSGFTARDYCAPRSEVDQMLAARGVQRLVQVDNGLDILLSEDLVANPSILSHFAHSEAAVATLLKVIPRSDPIGTDEKAWKLAKEGHDAELVELFKLGATDLVRIRLGNIPHLPSEAARKDFTKELSTLLSNRFGGARSIELREADIISDAPYALVTMRDETRVAAVLACETMVLQGQVLRPSRDSPLGPSYRLKLVPNSSSLLHEVCKTGCVKSVIFVISNNSPGGVPSRLICDLFTKQHDEMGLSPFHYAVVEKQWSIVMEFVKWRISAQPARDFPRSPLDMFPSLPHLTELSAAVAVGLPGTSSVFAFGDDSKFVLHSRLTDADADVQGYIRVKQSSNASAAARAQRSLITCDLDRVVGGQIVTALASLSDSFDLKCFASKANSSFCSDDGQRLADIRAHLRGETMQWIVDSQTADDRDNSLERERCKGLFRYHVAGGVLLRALSGIVEKLLCSFGAYGQRCFLALKVWRIACAKNRDSVGCTVDPSDGEVVIRTLVLKDETVLFPDVFDTIDRCFMLSTVMEVKDAFLRYETEKSWLSVTVPDQLVLIFLQFLKSIGEDCLGLASNTAAPNQSALDVLRHLHTRLSIESVTVEMFSLKLRRILCAINHVRDFCLGAGAASGRPAAIALKGFRSEALPQTASRVTVCVVPHDGLLNLLGESSSPPAYSGLQMLSVAAPDGARGSLKKPVMRGISLLLKARECPQNEPSAALVVQLKEGGDVPAMSEVVDGVKIVCGSSWPAAMLRQYTWTEVGISAKRLKRAMTRNIILKQPDNEKCRSPEETSVNDVSLTLLRTPQKQPEEPRSRRNSQALKTLRCEETTLIIEDLRSAMANMCPANTGAGCSPASAKQQKGARDIRSRRENEALDTFLLTVFEFSMDIGFALRVMRLVNSRWNQSVLRLLQPSSGSNLPPIFQTVSEWASRLDLMCCRLLSPELQQMTVRCGEVNKVLDLLRGKELLGSRLSSVSTAPSTAAQQLWRAFLQNPLLMFAHAATSCGLREAAFREDIPVRFSSKIIKLRSEPKRSCCVTKNHCPKLLCSDVIEAFFRDAYGAVRFFAQAAVLLERAAKYTSKTQKLLATPSLLSQGS
jgi:ankyrin repeat protein